MSQSLKEGEPEQCIIDAATVLDRTDVVASGNATIVVAGLKEITDYCRPLFTAIAGRVIEAGSDAA